MATKKATSSIETQATEAESSEVQTDVSVDEDAAHEAAESNQTVAHTEVVEAGSVEAATQSAASTPQAEFPRRYCVKNQTRMPVRLAVAPVDLGPAPATCTVLIRSLDQYRKMLNDLEALQVLNNLPAGAFVVEPIEEAAV